VIGGKDGIASVVTPTEEMRAILTANKESYEIVERGVEKRISEGIRGGGGRLYDTIRIGR